jgi:hypothetical protein
VLASIDPLCECLATVPIGALEWSLSRMNAHVVVEIMALPIEHIAVLMLTSEYLHNAVRARVLVLIHGELSSIRGRGLHRDTTDEFSGRDYFN